MDSSTISITGRFSDAFFGIVSGTLAVLLSLLVWIFLFDRTGIEPGAATEHSAARLWPVLFVLVLGSGAGWWFQRTTIRRLIVFGGVIVCTFASLAFHWVVLGGS